LNNYKKKKTRLSLFTIGDDKDEKKEPSAIRARRHRRERRSTGIVTYDPTKVSICCCYVKG